MLRAQVRRFVETEIKPHGAGLGGAGLRAARGAAPHGRAGLSRHPLSGRIRRLGDGHARHRRARRRARPLDLFGRRHHRARSHRHGLGAMSSTPAATAQKDALDAATSSPGEVITAVAVTEPDAGSDVKGIRTFARRDGDSYVLNGAKMFITNGVHADLYCVAAKTDRAGPPSQLDDHVPGREGHAGLHASAARSTSTAGAPPTPPNCISRTAAFRPRTCSARKAAASTRS